MTLITTHVAVESLIVWMLMGKKNREIFKEKLWLFALLTLFAAFPDLDTLFYIHRTYLHSVIWPLMIIIGVLVYLSYIKLIKKTDLGKKADLICRSIIIASVFLILHSILDLNPGPVLLFYPFDDRLYSMHVSMIWDLDSFFYIKELKFNWTSISFSEGINNSLFNLTPSQRIEYFGAEFIELFIGEFPIHFLTLLTWFVFFPGMAFTQWLMKRPKPENFFKKIGTLRNPMITISILLLSIGLIVGPGFRLHRIETRENTSWLAFSETESQFGAYRSFELDRKDALTVQGVFNGNTSTCEVAATITTYEDFVAVDESLTEMFELYHNNTGYSYNELVNDYRNTVQSFLDSSLTYYLISQNETEGITHTLTEKMYLYSVVLILDWNASSTFQVETKVTNTLAIERIVEFSLGMTIASIGTVLLTTTIVILATNKSKKEEKTIEVLDEAS